MLSQLLSCGPRSFKFSVASIANFLLLSVEFVKRSDVADGAMEALVVVVLHELGDELYGIIE